MALITSFFLIQLSAEEDEQEIALSDIPAIVLGTARKEVPGIELNEAEVETEEGRRVYELEGSRGEYRYVMEIAEDGKLLELHKAIAREKD